MPSFRHLSRIVSMQALFEYSVRKNRDPQKILDYNRQVFASKLVQTDFLNQLVFGVIKNREILDNKIREYAPEWPIEKLALVERIILEIGLYELIYTDDTPNAVIINEAVEIAKSYGDENSNKFINGVLSTAMKQLEKEKLSQKIQKS